MYKFLRFVTSKYVKQLHNSGLEDTCVCMHLPYLEPVNSLDTI
jgi:hypothetical protein